MTEIVLRLIERIQFWMFKRKFNKNHDIKLGFAYFLYPYLRKHEDSGLINIKELLGEKD